MTQRHRRAALHAKRAVHHAIRRARSATHRDKEPVKVHDVHIRNHGHSYTVNAPKRF